jgi:hypothetical protein
MRIRMVAVLPVVALLPCLCSCAGAAPPRVLTIADPAALPSPADLFHAPTRIEFDLWDPLAEADGEIHVTPAGDMMELEFHGRFAACAARVS